MPLLFYEWQQLLLPVHRCISNLVHGRLSSPSVLFLDARIESGPKDGRRRNRKQVSGQGLFPCCLFPCIELSSSQAATCTRKYFSQRNSYQTSQKKKRIDESDFSNRNSGRKLDMSWKGSYSSPMLSTETQEELYKSWKRGEQPDFATEAPESWARPLLCSSMFVCGVKSPPKKIVPRVVVYYKGYTEYTYMKIISCYQFTLYF